MSVQAVMFVLDRLAKNPALFGRYMDDPAGTLADFDLSPAETEALISGNREQLIGIGIDGRVAGWILRPRRSAGR